MNLIAMGEMEDVHSMRSTAVRPLPCSMDVYNDVTSKEAKITF